MIYKDSNGRVRSNATNLYDLLVDVTTVVIQEPLRLNMNHFIRYGTQGGAYIREVFHLGPSCGVIACFAGWMRELVGRAKEESNFYGEVVKQALNMMPESLEKEAEDLFWGTLHRSSSIYPFPDPEDYGTPEYAEAAVKNLHLFMSRHEATLKVTPVER